MMVNAPDVGRYDLSSLRLCISGGDRLPLELHTRFRKLLGVEIDEGCGMTEVIYTLKPRLAASAASARSASRSGTASERRSPLPADSARRP
jgi:long-chain acyl-CoA synthetase